MKKRNLLTAIFLLLVTLAQAQPNEKDDLLKQRDEIKKELGDLQKQLNQISQRQLSQRQLSQK